MIKQILKLNQPRIQNPDAASTRRIVGKGFEYTENLFNSLNGNFLSLLTPELRSWGGVRR